MCCSRRTDKPIICFIVYFMKGNDGAIHTGRDHDGDILMKILSRDWNSLYAYFMWILFLYHGKMKCFVWKPCNLRITQVFKEGLTECSASQRYIINFLFDVYKYLACLGLIKCHICTANYSTLQYLWKTIAFETCYNLKLGKTEPKFIKQVSPVMLACRKGICEGISGLLWLFLVGKWNSE